MRGPREGATIWQEMGGQTHIPSPRQVGTALPCPPYNPVPQLRALLKLPPAPAALGPGDREGPGDSHRQAWHQAPLTTQSTGLKPEPHGKEQPPSLGVNRRGFEFTSFEGQTSPQEWC